MDQVSISAAAELIAKANRRPDAARLHGQIRGLVNRGVLSTVQLGEGRKHRLALREVHLAQILCEAIDAGFIADDLSGLAAVAIHGRNVTTLQPVGTQVISLDANIPRALDGEDWLIEIARYHDATTGEARSLAQWARREGDGRVNRFGTLAADPTAPDAAINDGTRGGAPISSVLTLNVGTMIRRLATAIDGGPQ